MGKYQDQDGLPYCLPCIPGTYASSPGKITCDACKDGTYQPETNATTCIAVEEGQVVAGEGSTAVNVPLGSKIEASAPSGFEACKAGTIGNDPPNESCEDCTTGTSSTPGATTCQACDKGKFNDKTGGTCRNCVTETFQDQSASTSCNDCPTGWQQPKVGESSCVDLGGIKPENCGDDEYWVPDKFPAKDETSQAGCKDCPDGGSCVGAIGKEGIRALFGWSKCPNLNLTYSQCKFGGACNGAKNEILRDKYRTKDGDPALENQNESCSIAYKNNSFLCSACADTFSHSGLGDKCDACPTPAENNAIAVAGIVVGIAGLFVYVLITLSDEGKIDPADGAKTIGLSYVQIISLLTTFPIAWPDIFVSIFQIGGAVGKLMLMNLWFSMVPL
jgi:hypothetical protein